MAPILLPALNRCGFTPTAGGTADWVISAAITGFLTPVQAGGVDSQRYSYFAQSADLSQWEVGVGKNLTSSPPSFIRETIVFSSNANAVVNFSTAPSVYIDMREEDRVEPQYLRGYIAGLTLSNDANSPNVQIDISAGVCCSDDFTMLMRTTAPIGKTMSAWALGSNNGGLDTGAVAANTCYHVYLIMRPDTGVVDALFSTSASAPTMPSNYTIKRRIGSFMTDGSSNILPFSQFGDNFVFSNAVGDVSVTNQSTTAVLRALTVPTGIKVIAEIRINTSHATAGTQLLITSPDESDQAPLGSAGLVTAIIEVSSTGIAFGHVLVRTDTSGQIRTRSSAGTTTLRVSTYGWFDARGRFD